MVVAISAATPSQFPIAELSLSISAGAAFIRVRNPDMAFLPTRVCAADAFSASVICPNAPRRSVRISPRLRMVPSEFCVAMVISPNALPDSLTSFVSVFIRERSEVPAELALIPEFAISPSASVVSSTEKPNAPATGAAYLNELPSIDTLVFAFVDAAASTSAK